MLQKQIRITILRMLKKKRKKNIKKKKKKKKKSKMKKKTLLEKAQMTKMANMKPMLIITEMAKDMLLRKTKKKTRIG